MNLDREKFLKRKKYPIFLAFIILTTFYVFADLVDGDWNSLENSLDNLSVFFMNLFGRLIGKSSRRDHTLFVTEVGISFVHQLILELLKH